MVKIIVIDDSIVFRKSLQSVFENSNDFRIMGEFDNSDDAISFINLSKPDLVFLDIRLKDENGINTLKRIKRLFPDLKVIMVTNYPYMQYRAECNRLGAEYFFDKSMEFENLINVLNKIAACSPV